MPCWDKSVDVDVYLQAFGRSALTSGWLRDKWPVLLRTQLTDRALQVYNERPQQEAMNYDALKAALLLAFCAVPETHRTRFRTLKKDNETYQDFAFTQGFTLKSGLNLLMAII